MSVVFIDDNGGANTSPNGSPNFFGVWGGVPIHVWQSLGVESYSHDVSHRLSPLQPINGPVFYHYLGPGEEEVRISGNIFQHAGIGKQAGLERLIKQGESKRPYPLVLAPKMKVMGFYWLQNARRNHSELIASLSMHTEVELIFKRDRRRE